MSKINKKSEYVLVCYNDDGTPFYHPKFIKPVYRIQSFPNARGLINLRKLTKICPLALIYRQGFSTPIERYELGVLVPLENKSKSKFVKFYGKDISLLALKVYYMPEKLHEIPEKFKSGRFYSDIRIDEEGEEKSYWNLINQYLKGIFRGKYNTALIYNRNNEIIGKYIKANGQGKYHQQNFFTK